MKRAITVLLLVALPAFANDDEWQKKQWIKMLEQSASHLKNGEHADALRISNKIIDEMVDRLGAGSGAMKLFSVALTHKALAHAGLGENEDALWHWHTVVSLHPPFADDDFSMFGKAGEFLKAHPLPAERAPVAEKAPVVVDRIDMQFPHGAELTGVRGIIIFDVTVLRDGRVIEPRVLKTLDAPTLAYTALQTFRRWRLQPGQRNGGPVDARFTFTVDYINRAS